VYTGDREPERTSIEVYSYSSDSFHQQTLEIKDPIPMPEESKVLWININGLHDLPFIESMGKQFSIHSLVLEDILHTEQRPKVEDYGPYLFFVVKMLYYDEEHDQLNDEQVSMVLGKGFLLTFQEMAGDVFIPVRDRIRNNRGRIRREDPGFLVYSLLDSIIDQYFLILEKIGDSIEALEDEVTATASKESLAKVQHFRRQILFLRRSIWPLREMLLLLQRLDSPLVSATTKPYLRDLYDHVLYMIDTLESYREMAADFLDLYLSSMNNKMSSIMKTLTLITTIFMPLSFVAGLYGMNFVHMPELTQPFAYPAVLIIMGIIAVSFVIFFFTKKWF